MRQSEGLRGEGEGRGSRERENRGWRGKRGDAEKRAMDRGKEDKGEERCTCSSS